MGLDLKANDEVFTERAPKETPRGSVKLRRCEISRRRRDLRDGPRRQRKGYSSESRLLLRGAAVDIIRGGRDVRGAFLI
jgi:hypothetical protein